ncbi:MAG TPA: TPM domain-containing protein, partial [Firmicutes bacterium]|nr:TPM domain-containing protein [Bacillota bacterium]
MLRKRQVEFIHKLTAIVFTLAFFHAIFPSSIFAVTVAELGQPTGYVNDYTGKLTTSEKQRLESICAELEQANGTELAFVIIDTKGGVTIERFAQELFETWGIGKRGANNGVLVLVALNDREWRVHVGYGAEGVLPDNLARRIMENEAVPRFREDQYGAGLINAAIELSSVLKGEKYSADQFSPAVIGFIATPFIVLFLIGMLIWLAVRVKCPRCGSRVKLQANRELLKSTYSHSGIRKKEYMCTVCGHQFARMIMIPMLVQTTTTSSSGGWSGWTSSSSGGSSRGWSSSSG